MRMQLYHRELWSQEYRQRQYMPNPILLFRAYLPFSFLYLSFSIIYSTFFSIDTRGWTQSNL